MTSFSKQGWVFSQIPIWAACDPNLNDGALRLFVYLLWRQGTDAGCWPSVDRIAEDMKISGRAVQRRLKNLENCGYIRREMRKGRSTMYLAAANPNDANKKYTPKPKGVTLASPPPDTSVTHDENQEQESKDISENQTFASELLDESKRLNVQPSKHISAEERMAATRLASARGWARRTEQTNTHPSFEKALVKYGDDAPALRELQEHLVANFGLAPNWGSVSKVKEWTSGLSELYAAARGDISIAIAAGKKLRNDHMTVGTPYSIVITAQSIAAERATAYTAPSARAVKEYT